MRLLTFGSSGELSLTSDIIKDIPPYAILSHTLGEDNEEVILNDLKDGSGKSKAGYAKIQFCGEQARKDGIHYFWVDTCCIDKTNHAEVSEAIVSMFRWYSNAEKCYVYLSDVSIRSSDKNRTERTWESAFRESRWFTRAWTLQELIAPKSVEFFSQEGQLLGDKNNLERYIHKITKIPVEALRGAPLSDFSPEERMRWAEKRKTQREEDEAYCLLGIFNVFIPLIYGEGEHAFIRLKKGIDGSSRKYCRGLNLFDAPDMGEDFFVGRQAEFQKIDSILQPQSDSPDFSRRLLILGGMGGIGKTQLAITYTKRYRNSYSSIFWLNANTEATLNNSLRTLANRILPPESISNLGSDQVLTHVSNWLSELDNTRWLLIFDNHDDPGQYDIAKYYPSAAHGSIIITTRTPQDLRGEQIKSQHMTEEEDGLQILATRSGRQNIQSDAGARLLAHRLNGFPLALATAGTFLRQTPVNCTVYLERYNEMWQVTSADIGQLPEYPSRTLYTTWSLSLARIKQEMPQAVQLLAFLAYLDHQDVWYDLLCVDQNIDQPSWLRVFANNKFAFFEAMAVLSKYSLVETHYETDSYSLHTCVHDWTLDGLNRGADQSQYWLAFDCVASHIGVADWDHLSEIRYQRFTSHARRLLHDRFREAASQDDFTRTRVDQIVCLAELLRQQVQYGAGEQMYQRALAGYEKVLGSEHMSTLLAVNNLGILYYSQGKLALAEQYHQRALACYEKALGPEHASTLLAVNKLGNLYAEQGKLTRAEQYYRRALASYEKALGPEHTSTLLAVNNLGILYADQGKLTQAEQYYRRALASYEKALGPEHTSTLRVVNNLGILYTDQGKLTQAEQYYQRALAGYKKALGPKHTSTLLAVNNLGLLYRYLGKLAWAQQYFEWALAGHEKALGPEHTSTLRVVNNLGILYTDQGKLTQAEQYHQRALAGYKKALGPEHTSTLLAASNLGLLYRNLGKLAQAEQYFEWALAGYEKALGPEHTSTLMAVNNLGLLNRSQGKLARAEQYHQRALAGYEKALGPEHTSTLDTVNDLGLLYYKQGKITQAEEFYQRALAGYEKVLQSDNIPVLNTVCNLGLLFWDQGKLEKAKKMFHRAILGREKALGPHHLHTLEVVNYLNKLKADVEITENEGHDTKVGNKLSGKQARLKSLLYLEKVYKYSSLLRAADRTAMCSGPSARGLSATDP